MALVEDTTVRYMINSTTENFTFHLSKTLNELTSDDIKSQEAFTGFTSFAHNQLKEGVLSQGAPVNNPNHSWFWCTDPSYFSDVNAVCHWSTPPNFPDGVYMRTILVFRPLNVGANSSLTNARNNVRIVTDITPDSGTNMQNLAFDNPYVSCRYNNNQNGENRVTDYNYISPAVIIEVNNTLYLWVYGGLNWFNVYANSVLDQGYIDGYTNYNNESSYHRLAMGWTIGGVEGAPFLQGFTNNQIENYNLNGHSCTFGVNVGATNYHWRISESLTDNANKTITKMYLAFSGLKFNVDGTWYKPIIEGGIVTGYTDDFTKKSEWDDWTKATGHNVPTTGGGGNSDINDKELDMSTLMLSGSAGMVHYYEINKTGTATANQISDAISRFDISTIGKDLMRNLISFKAFAVLPTSEVFNNIIHVAGKDLKDDNDNYLMGDVIRGMSKLSLGTITIPTLYNDYRDYEPYTRIEMFVPFCGWFALPSWAMGKTITGEMFVDLYNGTCKAIIKASNTVVAETGGNVAYDIPFVAESTGAKAGAVISSALTTAVSAAGFAATPNIATGAAALSSAANLASAVNSNQTTLKGVLGDGSNVNGLNRCFIKVTRPQSPNGSTAIPDSYKHEIGIPTMKEITIKAGDGYIQVMDAKVNGTMTAREKQMIVDGFRHGLNF